MPDLDVVLINRHEVPAAAIRLAHELFHILTWDAMPHRACRAAAEGKRAAIG